MKKNFFKKLSFVLASAMVLSSIAPAAGAFAASAPKLTATKKYLHLDKDGYNEYDFNIKNKGKGWKYSWSSDNEDVATVDRLGVVTAEGVGTTKVSVLISDKDGEEIDELKATVVVRDNIESLTITNLPADNKLAVGAENNFNRDFVTVSENTEKTSGITRWVVTPAEGATINDSGIFVATKAGEYTITANAFQSKSKYESWLTDATKYADYVTATVDYKVTVPNEIKAVKAVKTNSLKVEFASAVAAVDKANFALANAATTSKVWIKSVALSDDKNSATVELYDNLVSGTAYSLTAKVDGVDMKGELNFVKGTPTRIEAAANQVAPALTNYDIKYTVYDENGLDVTADTTVYFQTTIGTSKTVNIANGVLIYATVYYVNPTTAAKVESNPISITGVTATGTDLVNYVVSTDQTTGVSFDGTVSLKKSANTYAVRVKVKDQYGTESVVPYGDASLSFESLDPSIFVVDATSGHITPQNVGTGSFRIKYGNTINVIKTITVKADSSVAGLKLDSTNLRVSATASAQNLNNATLKANYVDQYGDKMSTGTAVTVEVVAATANSITLNGNVLVAGTTLNTFVTDTGYTVAAVPSITSAASALLVVKGNGFSVNVTINAFAPDNTMVNYTIDGVKNLDVEHEYDASWKGTNDYTTTLKLYAVNSAGFKVTEVTGASIDLEIRKPDGSAPIVATMTGSGKTITTSDAATINFLKGTYTVIAKNSSTGATYATASFTVTDSGVAPSLSLSTNKFTGVTVTTGDIAAKLSGLGSFAVTGIKFVSSNNAVVDTQNTSWVTSIPVKANSSATLYNVVVQVTSGGRNFSIGLENLVLSQQ